jgi:formylglycine-generating enzyme required for sulfatase activity
LLTKSQWEKGGQVLGPEKKVLDLGATSSLPVLRVTVEEAHQCATWLGGDLPTTRQWLTAAGRHEQGIDGPFMGNIGALRLGEDIAVKRQKQGPMPVGSAAKDVSPNGCRDMAGNGREWTRTTAKTDNPEDDDEVVRFPASSGSRPKVWLMGHPYDDEEPLLFATDVPDQVSYGSVHYNVGFRVVIEPPATAENKPQ